MLMVRSDWSLPSRRSDMILSYVALLVLATNVLLGAMWWFSRRAAVAREVGGTR